MNKKVIYVLSITIIIITSIIAIIIFNGFINMSDIKNTNAKLNSNEAIELKLNKADSDNEELYVRINNLSISAMTLGIFFSKDSLEYVNNMENSNYSNGRLLYTWVSETGKNEKISDIGPFKFKRKNDSDSKIVVTGEFYNENGEKIDVIEWNEDPSIFISAALLPAQVMAVDIKEEEKFAQVIVPDDQLSLAIGKAGQNARLAAKLTNWKIDIKSESQFREIMMQAQNEQESTENEE